MVKCWQCAETIQPEALRCRFCGAEQTARAQSKDGYKGKSGPEAEKRGFWGMGGVLLVLISVLALLAQCFGAETAPPAEERVEEPAPYIPEQAHQACLETMKRAKAEKLYTERGQLGRFYFNEVTWNLMTAETKKQMMSIMACAVHRRVPDALQPGERIEIYGIHNDKVIGSLTVMGFEIN